MAVVTKTALEVFAPTTSSGELRGADMGEAQLWGTEVERLAISAAASGGALVFDSKSNLDAALTYAAYSMAWVVADSTPANNAIYRKVGGSGSGSWSRIAELPFQVIPLAVGGTANALVGTSTFPVPAGDRTALVVITPAVANTGAATLSVNGGPALPILDRSGNPISSGFLVAGGAEILTRVGASWRAFIGVDFAGAVASVAADRAATEAARDAAISAVGVQFLDFVSRAAITSTSLGVGVTYVRTAGYTNPGDGGGALYKRVSSEPSHPGKVSSSNGVWFEIAGVNLNPLQFGAVGGGANDQTAIANCITTAVAFAAAHGATVVIDKALSTGSGLYFPPSIDVKFKNGGKLIGLASPTNVTIEAELIAGRRHIFDGVTIFYGKGQTVFPEWWGAVGYNGLAVFPSSPVDSQPAWQKAMDAIRYVGGVVKGDSVVYFWSTNCNLRGSSNALHGDGRGTTRICLNGLASTSALQVLGETGTLLQNSHVLDIDFFRNKASSGGIGLYMNHTAAFQSDRCKWSDFGFSIYFDHATNTKIDKNIFTNTQGSADYTAIFIGGSDTRGNVSSVITNCVVEARGNTNANKRALHVTGANPHDLKFIGLETQGCNRAALIDLAGGIAPNRWGDIQFIGCAIDGWDQYGVRCIGGDARSAVSFIGGWLNPTPGSAECIAFDIEGMHNFNVVGGTQVQDVADTGKVLAFRVVNSTCINIRDAIVTDANKIAYFDNSTDCDITGSTFASGGARTRTLDIEMTASCVRVKSSGNKHRGLSLKGVKVASGATSCEISDSNFTGITTPIDDLASGTIKFNNLGA